MKSKTFVALVVILGVLGLAAFYSLKHDRSQRQSRMGQRLFGDLAVNSVAGIRLIGPDNEVRLRKGAAVWEAENLYGYPADFDKIAELVKKIKELKVGRAFTADTGVRERLALFVPQEAGAKPAGEQGTRVVLTDGGGRILTDILLGKPRETDSGTTGGQHLMRLAPKPSDTVYLVDQSFRFLKTDPANWLVKALIDVDPDEVRQAVCYDLKGDRLLYRLSRSEKGKPAALDGIGDKETPDGAKIERVMGALAGLSIDGVAGGREAVDMAALDIPRRFEYRLFDGTVYTLETAKQAGDGGDVNYLKVSVAYQPPAPVAEPATAEIATTDNAQKAPEDPAGNAQGADAKLRPWTYTIATWKYEALVADRGGLLKQEG